MTILSATLLIFFVLDPIGNMPLFISTLKNVSPIRQRTIIIRELLIALFVLVIFLFSGRYILALLEVSQSSLGIAGGLILLMIAIKMIFPGASNMFGDDESDGEPFIVPLAIPLTAGPSAMATLILLMAHDPSKWYNWLIALIIAWFLAGIIQLFSIKISKLLGPKTVIALERLMGMVLTMIAVQMLVTGIKQAFMP